MLTMYHKIQKNPRSRINTCNSIKKICANPRNLRDTLPYYIISLYGLFKKAFDYMSD